MAILTLYIYQLYACTVGILKLCSSEKNTCQNQKNLICNMIWFSLMCLPDNPVISIFGRFRAFRTTTVTLEAAGW